MEHASVLFATHDLDMVMDIADRIVILKDGQLALNLAVADIDKETIINLLLT
jgi:ABC-type sugar transport system ATPase subunit